MYALASSVTGISSEPGVASSTPASLTAPSAMTVSDVVASSSFTPAEAMTRTYLPCCASVSVKVGPLPAPSMSSNVP